MRTVEEYLALWYQLFAAHFLILQKLKEQGVVFTTDPNGLASLIDAQLMVAIRQRSELPVRFWLEQNDHVAAELQRTTEQFLEGHMDFSTLQISPGVSLSDLQPEEIPELIESVISFLNQKE